MARYQGSKLVRWLESVLENWMGLEINRDKTRVVNLRVAEASLDFLGYTFRYDRDRQGRPWRYLNMGPSKKALEREREKLRGLTHTRLCFKPIPQLIRDLNRHLRGWANYFRRGYPRQAFRAINWFVQRRLASHLKRRSQRPFRPPKGVTWYRRTLQLGLVPL